MSAAEWYVVVTRPQSERRTARALRRLGYRVYVPTMRSATHNRRTGKWTSRRLALFGTYVLVRLTRLSSDGRPDWMAMLTCDGVLAVLGGEEPVTISRHAVRQIMIAQRRGQFDALHRNARRSQHRRLLRRFPPGSQARIADGPFGGLSMKVVRVSGRSHIIGEIPLLGQTISITVTLDQIADAA